MLMIMMYCICLNDEIYMLKVMYGFGFIVLLEMS